MRVHVTGAGGFIGRHLMPALERAGHEVQSAVSAAQAVVHLAGIAHRRAGSEELQEVNVRLAERVARQSAAAGARLVFVSSVKVHGEESTQPLTESSPLAPADAYSQSKAQAEAALRSISGLHLVVLRPPLVYGPHVQANFLALMKAIARGIPLPVASVQNRRSFAYVGNLVDAILRCIADPRAIGRTYLISDDMALSTPALCRAIGAALGRPARLFPFPARFLPGPLSRSLEVDDRALRTELAWRAPFSIEEALRATTDWYRSR
jgi:nucleoside-diphosphate-sugar epimerase